MIFAGTLGLTGPIWRTEVPRKIPTALRGTLGREPDRAARAFGLTALDGALPRPSGTRPRAETAHKVAPAPDRVAVPAQFRDCVADLRVGRGDWRSVEQSRMSPISVASSISRTCWRTRSTRHPLRASIWSFSPVMRGHRNRRRLESGSLAARTAQGRTSSRRHLARSPHLALGLRCDMQARYSFASSTALPTRAPRRRLRSRDGAARSRSCACARPAPRPPHPRPAIITGLASAKPRETWVRIEAVLAGNHD